MDMKTLAYLADILLTNEYISKIGWVRSLLEQKVIDASGKPIPWYAYPAIDILTQKENLLKYLNVFEFGCGYGTQWWAAKAHKVTIIEHNREFYDKMVLTFPKNVRTIYKPLSPGGEYSKILKRLLPIKFDIIIIDGRDRVNCCYNCIDSLTDQGVIIFDNSNRKEYVKGKEYLKNAGFKELQLFGFSPMVPVAENSTSFFYRTNNCLDF